MKKILIAICIVTSFLQASDELKCKEFNSFKQPDDYTSCLQEFIDQNNPIATKQLADFYYMGQQPYKNYQKAVEWYLKVESQNVAVQHTLGQIYTFGGYGINKDYKQAAYWYEKAMQKGSIPARINLANFYVRGLGVEQDCKKAIMLYQDAADQNHWAAQDALGHLYFEGLCVQKDIQKAKHWIRLGHKNGNTNTWFWNRQNWGPIE
ncbi:tetratricopeptide repeat protein [Arcobacter arenosus]|jgi:TPR repeat protein|uniref:tetratricopeptide repeat protein n=1 Tax=Arcobacter arenosus TaxID=2576037 RepID=UPI003BA86AFA